MSKTKTIEATETARPIQKPYLEFIGADGATWAVPASVIAEDKARYYSSKPEPEFPYEEELKMALEDDAELVDWAKNNLDWNDVRVHAVCIEPAPSPDDEDWQEAWLTAEFEVIR